LAGLWGYLLENYIYNMDYTDLIGRPFKHGGRGPESFDCLGLILWVLRQNGCKVDDPCIEYAQDWTKDKSYNYFIENYYKQWDKVDKPELLDVVLFGTDKDYPVHAGIVVARNIFIHCSSPHGVIISRLSRVREQINGFYRLKNANT
jgi:cell wall-associated NlpC family hydrolase